MSKNNQDLIPNTLEYLKLEGIKFKKQQEAVEPRFFEDTDIDGMTKEEMLQYFKNTIFVWAKYADHDQKVEYFIENYTMVHIDLLQVLVDGLDITFSKSDIRRLSKRIFQFAWEMLEPSAYPDDSGRIDLVQQFKACNLILLNSIKELYSKELYDLRIQVEVYDFLCNDCLSKNK